MGAVEWSDWDGVLFDLDGVLTPTAEVHRRAWHELFARYLAEQWPDAAPYTEDDYFAHIDGLPRYDGVRRMLASRDITLPDGSPDDSPQAATVCGLGNRKNALFSQVLADDGVQPYPGSVQLLDQLADLPIALAVVSSSRNARAVLEAAGLASRFTVVVDGQVAAEQGLAGKPAPDTFVAAAGQLDVPVARSIVVEDAISGVQAGRAGSFGRVIGVDRGVGHEALTRAGADVVVSDLAELVTAHGGGAR